MSILGILLVIAAAGGVGGILAAVLGEDRGFPLPKKVSGADGTQIYRPGFLGLILVGAAAAALSFALYGPLTAATVVGGEDPATAEQPADDNYGLTLAALGGAVLVGAGGSKWLASQVDSALLRKAASTAAAAQPDDGQALAIANATPSGALEIARAM